MSMFQNPIPGRPVINYTASMNKLYKHIQGWNSRVALSRQVRAKYGSGGCHEQTALNIFRDYIDKFIHRQAFTNKLKITRTFLSKNFCTPRTIYNHLQRLLDAGILIGKRFSFEDFSNGKGFINCLYLELNPALLVYEKPTTELERTAEPSLINTAVKRFFRLFSIDSQSP